MVFMCLTQIRLATGQTRSLATSCRMEIWTATPHRANTVERTNESPFCAFKWAQTDGNWCAKRFTYVYLFASMHRTKSAQAGKYVFFRFKSFAHSNPSHPHTLNCTSPYSILTLDLSSSMGLTSVCALSWATTVYAGDACGVRSSSGIYWFQSIDINYVYGEWPNNIYKWQDYLHLCLSPTSIVGAGTATLIERTNERAYVQKEDAIMLDTIASRRILEIRVREGGRLASRSRAFQAKWKQINYFWNFFCVV